MEQRAGRRLSVQEEIIKALSFTFLFMPFVLFGFFPQYSKGHERKEVISCSPPASNSQKQPKDEGQPDNGRITGCHAQAVIINQKSNKHGKTKATEHSCDLG